MRNRHDFTDMDPRDWHIDTLQNNILVGYRPTGFIGDQLFPVVTVTKQTNVYAKINQGDWWRRPVTDRPLGTKANEVRFTVSSDTYLVQNRALETVVPWATMDNSDPPHQPITHAGMFLNDQLLLDYEVRVENTIATGTGSATTLTGAQAWDDFVNSNPLANLETAWEAIRSTTGYRPNVAVIGEKAWLKVRRHPQLLRAAFPGAGVGGILTPDRLAELMQVDRLLVGRTIRVTSVPGTLETALAFSDVWSTAVHLLHVAPPTTAGQFTATFGLSFRWTGPNIGSGGPGNFQIMRKSDDDREVERIKTSYWQDEKIVASQLGHSINTGITA